ncbi:MAG: hypothetical protein EOO22_04060 [Comamonadaceae bacterium]|nr:MAG: hypothetical protein EOO22_04060 [Comamonadaceae bacterium]
MDRPWSAGLCALAAVVASGCSSLVAEGSSAVAGIAGSSISSAVTDSAGAAAGIGIGVQAAARAGVQYQQRRIHDQAQDQVSRVAGPLKVGQVARWKTRLSLPLESEEAGRVTVSRVISQSPLECKEIVFSVDRATREEVETDRFYVAAICRNGKTWSWASAEPATPRWGSLQ